MSDHSHVPLISRLVRSVATVLVALLATVVATLAGAPAATAATTTATTATTTTASSAGRHPGLHGDTVAPSAHARTGSLTWRGRAIYYYETVPSAWDWSLSQAVAKWNSTGATIRFVRTTDRSRANLTIGYGDTQGAAGLATVGRTAHAWVRLSTAYADADGTDAHNRVEVLGIFAHELGHVLGFSHTTTPCSLMSPVLDVSGCGVVTDATPGYYRCRTLDNPLVARFVRTYGGRTHYLSSSWCLIDPRPSALRVAFGGDPTGPVTVSWERPTVAPSGSRVQIQHWSDAACGAAPLGTTTTYADPTASRWQDTSSADALDNCFAARLVNRYGVGSAPVGASLRRALPATVAPQSEVVQSEVAQSEVAQPESVQPATPAPVS